MAQLKTVIQIDVTGVDEAIRKTRTVSNAVEDFTKKLNRADFSVVSDLEKKLKSADFSVGSKAVGGLEKVEKQLGLTKNQALQLSYQFNDVAASLASGSSPFTILLQQGGQVTQAFGGITNTFRALLPYVIRFAPAIAAVVAGIQAFSGLKAAEEAAASIVKLSDQADKAKLSIRNLQKVIAAGAAAGVPSDEIASGLARISQEALKAATQQSKLNGQLDTARRNAAFGLPGAAEEFKRLNAEKPDNIFAKLGQSLSGFRGSVGDSLPAIKQLADALVRLPQGLRRDQIIAEAEATFGEGLTKVLLRGSKGIEDYGKKVEALVPALKPATVEAAKSAQELLGVYDEAQKRAADQKGALFLPALVSFQRLLLQTFNSSKPLLEDFAKELEVFFGVLSGDKSKAAQSPLTAGFAEGLLTTATTLGDVLKVVGTLISSFYGEVDKAVQSLNALAGTDFKTWAVVAIGALGLIFGPIGVLAGLIIALISYWPILKQAAIDAGAAIKNYWNGLDFSTVWEGFKTSALNAFNWVLQKAQETLQSIKNFGANALSGLGSAFSGAAQSLGSAIGLASGGYVSGPGSATSDSIPAWLSNGEFVVRAAAVKRFGVGFFHALNGMRVSTAGLGGGSGFAAGGLVSSTPQLAGVSASGRSFNLVLDGRTFAGLTGQTDTVSALEKYAALRQLSATSKRAPSRIG